MNAAYVRISKEDLNHPSGSIENQKRIINQYAKEHGLTIDRWYEDHGISGYSFERPGFCKMIEDLEKDIDTVFIKDFSRLGRHNARTLLFIEELKEKGKTLISIDENYNSVWEKEDLIGIQTWFNERYIKDISRKIKKSIHARQKDGVLYMTPPFGYIRDCDDRSKISIVKEEADYICKIYDLYIAGSGYRKIAQYLTKQGIPTPSMARHKHDLEKGKISKRKVAFTWSESMVKEILNNDFYIGTLRLRKRERAIVHGKDRRVPKEEQYIFENEHEKIIEKEKFFMVKEIRRTRKESCYRGSRTEDLDLFSECLFCSDCGKKMTVVRRMCGEKLKKYYICKTYNAKGRTACQYTHSIREDQLIAELGPYMKMWEEMNKYKTDHEKEKNEEIDDRMEKIKKKKEQLKIMIEQKITDLSYENVDKPMIEKIYGEIEKQLLAEIKIMEEREEKEEKVERSNKENMYHIIDRIEVGKDHIPIIKLKGTISCKEQKKMLKSLNSKTDEIFKKIIELFMSWEKERITKKELSLYVQVNDEDISCYIRLMEEAKIIEKSERGTYMIIVKKENLYTIRKQFT